MLYEGMFVLGSIDSSKFGNISNVLSYGTILGWISPTEAQQLQWWTKPPCLQVTELS